MQAGAEQDTTEQDVATMTVTRGEGTSYTTRITDSEVSTNPLAQAAAVASSLVRVRPEMTVSVTGNAEARRQHARRRDLFAFLGQKPCTCPKTYRLISSAYRADEKPRPFVQDITDPQADCPCCGYLPAEQTA
ncbi:hypothetical protein RF644_17695 [Kocuria sp. CPCC 205258]|uniref:hypothetical protein n=1 Tax=Kocuria sp. CPCC 205258 TaxID=3073552 RepID=UPI0034D4768B